MYMLTGTCVYAKLDLMFESNQLNMHGYINKFPNYLNFN